MLKGWEVKDINKIIEKVSKRNLVFPVEMHYHFRGKKYNFTLFRHYDGRQVSICNRANCNAGNDCCHYTKVEGIGLCCSISNYYTLRIGKDLTHLVAQGITFEEESNYINFAQNILDIIGGNRKLPDEGAMK